MDTIYTEWSCMAAALTAGMTLMMVYDGLRLCSACSSATLPFGQAWRICFTGLEPGCPFFSCSAGRGQRGGNAGIYDCLCADWNGFL